MRKYLGAFAVAVLVSVVSLPAQALDFQALLTPDQEVRTPGVVSSGSGFGTLLLSEDMTSALIRLEYSDLTSGVVAAHLHLAPFGVNGGIIFNLMPEVGTTSGSLERIWSGITTAQADAINAGNVYFNIHTVNYPGGEIRGQILQVPEPGTMALFVAGALPLGLLLRRRRK